MARPKKAAVDPTVEEVKPPKEKKVKLFTYSIKMVIPTGQYANIQPEITVKGGTLEEAHAYCAPHMNKLWKEYFLISERRVEPPVAPKAPETKPEPAPVNNMAEVAEKPAMSSVALTKATQAIQSCLSLDALDLIANQVRVSVKLTEDDKKSLMPMLEERFNQLAE